MPQNCLIGYFVHPALERAGLQRPDIIYRPHNRRDIADLAHPDDSAQPAQALRAARIA